MAEITFKMVEENGDKLVLEKVYDLLKNTNWPRRTKGGGEHANILLYHFTFHKDKKYIKNKQTNKQKPKNNLERVVQMM